VLHIYIYIYIYDISRLRVKGEVTVTSAADYFPFIVHLALSFRSL